jgi:hypothetical protein
LEGNTPQRQIPYLHKNNPMPGESDKFKNMKAGGLFVVGIGVGTAIGVATHNIAIGAAVGAIVGLALAAMARRKDY